MFRLTDIDISFDSPLMQNFVIPGFLFLSSMTYTFVLIGSLCARKSFNKYCDESLNEFVGKSNDARDYLSHQDVTVKPHSKVDIPLVREELESLKQTHTFGICRWNNGPFLEFSDLTFTNNKLYGIRNNSKISVAKFIETTKNTTRPRWINHLFFVEDGNPILFKDYLTMKHGITFS